MRQTGCLVALCAFVLAFTYGQATARNVTRTCEGRYLLDFTWIDGVKPHNQVFRVGSTMRATRSCGASVPNRCRQRAYAAIKTCTLVHWEQRWTRNVVPTHCGAAEGIRGYLGTEPKDLKDALELRACCGHMQQHYTEVYFKVLGQSSGDKGCGGDTRTSATWLLPGAGNYRADCRTVRPRLCPTWAAPRRK